MPPYIVTKTTILVPACNGVRLPATIRSRTVDAGGADRQRSTADDTARDQELPSRHGSWHRTSPLVHDVFGRAEREGHQRHWVVGDLRKRDAGLRSPRVDRQQVRGRISPS